MDKNLTYAEINLNAIRHNFRVLRRLAGKTKLLAVVKADAYGHGMVEVASLLQRPAKGEARQRRQGVGWFGVSDIFEGIRLRQTGIRKPILLFESTLSAHAKPIVDYKLTPTLCTWELASSLNRYAQKVKKRINIHIKVDTGMGRLGVWHKEAFDFIKRVSHLKSLAIQGIYTHFPVADTDRKFTQNQIKQFNNLIARLSKTGIKIPYVHAANSMGLAGYRIPTFNLARPGLMIYGLYPHPRLKIKIKLKPALSVKSKVVFLKTITKGRSISYGRTFIAKKRMTVATIPIGYNNGYLRGFSNKAFVVIAGVRCPVLGRVTMDEIVVDASRVKSIKLGSAVTILGAQGRAVISADDLARYAHTINYEIVCGLGNRLPRLYPPSQPPKAILAVGGTTTAFSHERLRRSPLAEMRN